MINGNVKIIKIILNKTEILDLHLKLLPLNISVAFKRLRHRKIFFHVQDIWSGTPEKFTGLARFVQDLMFMNMRKHGKFALKV